MYRLDTSARYVGGLAVASAVVNPDERDQTAAR
jgi:hypothetical protein